MTTLAIDVRDLVRIPWKLGAAGPEAFDCWQLMRAALARAEKHVPEDLVGSGYETMDEALARVERARGRFEKLGGSVWHAHEIGDVVETWAPDGGRGVATLVLDAPKRFLTTTRKTGSRIVTASQLESSCLAVWRWIP